MHDNQLNDVKFFCTYMKIIGLCKNLHYSQITKQRTILKNIQKYAILVIVMLEPDLAKFLDFFLTNFSSRIRSNLVQVNFRVKIEKKWETYANPPKFQTSQEKGKFKKKA